MNVTEHRTQTILEDLQDKHCAEYCSHYGEPGYSDPDKGILFCNWNDVSKQVQQYLEEAGYALEWSDEWYVDYNNDKAWRTSPTHYGWQCQVAVTDGDVLTPDDDISDWIEVFQDDPNRALPSRISESELKELGWEKLDERFENGFYPGQNDDPKKIFDEQIKRDDVEHVLFRIADVGQFDVRFECWVLPREVEE